MSEPTPATPPPTEPPDRGPPPSSSSHHPEQLRRSQCSGMDVEETLPPQYPPAKASFRDVVSGTARCFPTATALTEQLREDTEALLPGPDTPHKVSFSPHQLQILRAPWSQTLMGKVLGASVRYEILKLRIPLLWKTQGKLDIIDLGKAIFLFKFELKSDLERIMLGGPWFLFGHYLMLTRWQPNFRPSANPFSSMLVWVRFPELPVEYFHKQALFEIAKLVGLPIKVDLATDSVSRARYARVCIEISLLKPLVSKIWVENAWQQIKYENLDLLCFSCGIVGHLAAHCNQGVDGQQFELPSASPSLPPPDNQSLDKLSPRSAPVTTGAMPNPTVSPGPSTQKSFKHSEEWIVVRAHQKSPPQSSKAGPLGHSRAPSRVGLGPKVPKDPRQSAPQVSANGPKAISNAMAQMPSHVASPVRGTLSAWQPLQGTNFFQVLRDPVDPVLSTSTLVNNIQIPPLSANQCMAPSDLPHVLAQSESTHLEHDPSGRLPSHIPSASSPVPVTFASTTFISGTQPISANPSLPPTHEEPSPSSSLQNGVAHHLAAQPPSVVVTGPPSSLSEHSDVSTIHIRDSSSPNDTLHSGPTTRSSLEVAPVGPTLCLHVPMTDISRYDSAAAQSIPNFPHSSPLACPGRTSDGVVSPTLRSGRPPDAKFHDHTAHHSTSGVATSGPQNSSVSNSSKKIQHQKRQRARGRYRYDPLQKSSPLLPARSSDHNPEDHSLLQFLPGSTSADSNNNCTLTLDPLPHPQALGTDPQDSGTTDGPHLFPPPSGEPKTTTRHVEGP